MKILFTSAIALFLSSVSFCQKISIVYDDFDGNKVVCYPSQNVNFDSISKNPSPNPVNKSEMCARFTRNSEKKFDNLKMCLASKLNDVSPYATYSGIPPKIKMKIFTSAPPGTLIEILLGSKGRSNEYPEGTHSQYQAYTTKSNEWEEIEFKFSQIPKGSETASSQIDQLTLLFNPNSSSNDVFYFDEITGPALTNNQSEVIPASKK